MVAWQYLVTAILISFLAGLIVGYWRIFTWHLKETGKTIEGEIDEIKRGGKPDVRD